MCRKPRPWMVIFVMTAGCWLHAAAADSPIAHAARAGDLEQVRELIAQGENVDAMEADGSTALLWAAHQSHPEMVEALLEAGADPDIANDFGVTPLLQASRHGDARIMSALVGGGATVGLASPRGETPLMAASRSGNVEAVRLLLQRGADPNATESLQEQTALMWAVAEGHPGVVDALLDAGADPNMRARVTSLTERSINADFPTGGFTAAMWAARNGEEAILRRLVEGGADLNITNGDGATPMMIAIVNDRFDLAATLLELGADPNDGSLYQAVVMRDATTDWLAQDGSRLRPDHPNELTALDLIEILLAAGADPNKPFTGQMHNRTMCCDAYANATPFFRAAVAADVAALDLFIARGADLEWSPAQLPDAKHGANAHVGKTPLMVAMNGGQGVPMSGGPGDIREGRPPPFREAGNRNPADAVRLLLEAGADPDAVTPEGDSALHQAVKSGKPAIIRMLAEAGATLDKPNGDGLTPLDLAEQTSSGQAEGVPAGEDDRASPGQIAALLRELAGAREGSEPTNPDEGDSP